MGIPEGYSSLPLYREPAGASVPKPGGKAVVCNVGSSRSSELRDSTKAQEADRWASDSGSTAYLPQNSGQST